MLLGPVTNPFLIPQGLNNKFWYKTYFNTYSSEAAVSVSSFGGSVTHRLAVTLAEQRRAAARSWRRGFRTENLFTGARLRASYYQPWIRLAETDVGFFNTVFSVTAPTFEARPLPAI